jgi:hypothetical protein
MDGLPEAHKAERPATRHLDHCGTADFTSYEWRDREGNPMPIAGVPAMGSRVGIVAPTVDGDYHVTLKVTDAAGRNRESTALLNFGSQRALITPEDIL